MAEPMDTILVVDDNEINGEVLCTMLEQTYRCIEARSGLEAIEILKKQHQEIALVLLDLMMPEIDGMDVLAWMWGQEWAAFVPVIVISSNEDAQTIDRVYELGAKAFLSRSVTPPLLLRNIQLFIDNAKQSLEHVERMQMFEHQAAHDGLTGLLNQSAQRRRVEQLLLDESTEYVMAVFDLDMFKQVNDTRGHDFGNKVLIKAASRLEMLLADGGIAARIGGDEFLLFVPLHGDIDAVGQRIRERLSFELDGLSVSASIGLVSTGYVGRKYNDLFLCADYALYFSKRNGRNRYTVYSRTEEEKGLEKMISRELNFASGKNLDGGFFVYRAGDGEELIYVNHSLVQMFGFEDEYDFRRYVGNSFRGIVHPDDLTRVESGIKKQIHGENGAFDYVEYRIQKKDGTVCWVEDHGKYVFTSEFGYVYYVYISEIKDNLEGHKPRLLIVDDQRMNRALLADILQDSYEIDQCDSAQEAIDILDSRIRLYDLLLLDLIMPEMDGFAVLEHMNRMQEMEMLPVIAISSDTHLETITKAYNMGALDVISRPYNPSHIKRRIRNCIELFHRDQDHSVPQEGKRTILVAEASRLNCCFLSRMLGDVYRVLTATSFEETEILLRENATEISLIILDMHLVERGGYELIDWMKKRELVGRVPVIAETVSGGLEDNLHALYAGAADYIIKPYRTEMVKKRVAAVIENCEMRRIVEHLKFDRLTGVYSKAYFAHALEEMLRKDPCLSYDVVLTNVRGFHQVRILYGRETSERVIRRMADTLRTASGDRLYARTGIDHFILVLPHQEGGPYDMLREMDRQLRDTLEKEDNLELTMEYGVYEEADPTLDIDRMLEYASEQYISFD